MGLIGAEKGLSQLLHFFLILQRAVGHKPPSARKEFLESQHNICKICRMSIVG